METPCSIKVLDCTSQIVPIGHRRGCYRSFHLIFHVSKIELLSPDGANFQGINIVFTQANAYKHCLLLLALCIACIQLVSFSVNTALVHMSHDLGAIRIR